MISAPKPPNAFQYAWRNPWFRLVVFALLAAAAYYFTRQIGSILVNFAVAYLIAYIANPVLNWLERGREFRFEVLGRPMHFLAKMPRGGGVLLVLLLFGGLLTMAGFLFATIAGQLIELFRQLPTLIGNIEGWLDTVIQQLSQRGVTGLEEMKGSLITNAQAYLRDLGANIVPMLQKLLDPNSALLTSIATIGGMLGRVLIIILMSVYLMLDYSRVNKALLKMFPRPWQPRVLEFADLAGTAIGGYVRGQLLIALFVGTVVAVGLWALGIPSALAIGFLAGVFNIIPYLGPIIGAVPAILLAAPMGMLKVVLAIGVFVLANQVEGSFLSPMVLSKTTDLHPITVLLSILIGASLFGFAGALVSVPLVALGKLAVEKYYYSSRVYTEGP